LQHLGPETAGTALEVEGLQDRLGGGGDITGFGNPPSLLIQVVGLLKQLATIGAVGPGDMGPWSVDRSTTRR